LVGGEEVVQGREEEASGLFFGGDAEELGVEGHDFVVAERKLVEVRLIRNVGLTLPGHHQPVSLRS
jgi:hypothetical protein